VRLQDGSKGPGLGGILVKQPGGRFIGGVNKRPDETGPEDPLPLAKGILLLGCRHGPGFRQDSHQQVIALRHVDQEIERRDLGPAEDGLLGVIDGNERAVGLTKNLLDAGQVLGVAGSRGDNGSSSSGLSNPLHDPSDPLQILAANRLGRDLDVGVLQPGFLRWIPGSTVQCVRFAREKQVFCDVRGQDI
jgi:hypothetical protein